MAAGADPNAGDAAFTTPFHFAIFAGHVGALEALVCAGAAVNAKVCTHASRYGEGSKRAPPIILAHTRVYTHTHTHAHAHNHIHSHAHSRTRPYTNKLLPLLPACLRAVCVCVRRPAPNLFAVAFVRARILCVLPVYCLVH